MIKSIFLLCLILCNLNFGFSLQCSKVGDLPSDLKQMLPDYDKLNKFHLNNFFFIDQEQTKFSMNIADLSVLKLLIIPRHINLKLEIYHNSKLLISYNAEKNRPIDYSNYEGIKGDIELRFTGEKEIEEETIDEVCNESYMKFEFSIQKLDNFKAKLKNVRKINNKLDIFELDFENMLHSLPIDTELSQFKIPLHSKDSDKYDNSGKTNVLKEYDLILVERKGKEKDSLEKYELKMEITSDFLFSGSTFIVLAREDEKKDELEDLICLSQGKCIISDRNSKNMIFLHSSLTPGNYKLYIIDIQSTISFKALKKHIDYFPIGVKLKLYSYEQENENFNCEGFRLPSQITIENLINFKENYEINEGILMNMKTLRDTTLIKTETDSMLRVIATHSLGQLINIELVSGNNTLEKVEGFEETTGLIYSLKKNTEYILSFIYVNSVFDENKSSECQSFHLRLGILSVEYHNKISNHNQFCKDKPNFKVIDDVLSELQHISSSKNNIEETENYEKYTITLKNNLQRSSEVLYMKDFEVDTNILLNFEILSDFTSGFLVPYIIKHNEKNLEKSKIFQKVSFATGGLNIDLKRGKYTFYLYYAKNQFSKSIESSIVNNSRLATEFFPKCLSFQVRFVAFLLDKSSKKWECQNRFFNYLPKELNNVRDLGTNNLKDHYTYFSHSLLLPENSQIVKIKTLNNYFFLKLSYEFNPKDFDLAVSLKLGDKYLKKSKPFKNKILQSTQFYLTYLLKPNKEYELELVNLSNNPDPENHESENNYSHFENCKLFDFHMEFTSKNYLENTKKPLKCDSITPKINEVFYERLVGIPNSFFRFGDRRMMWGIRRGANEQSQSFDLASINNKMFQFLKSETAFKYTFPFEIHYLNSKLSARLEVNFETNLLIYVTRRTESNSAVIAMGEITGLNTIEITGLSLEGGKYELTIVEANYNKFINKKYNFCNNFTLSVLLENKPFNYFSRALVRNKDSHSNAELCNVDTIPEHLNIPGFIFPDSDNSINEIYKFLLTEKDQFTKFSIKNKSLFKLNILPLVNNNNFGYVRIYKEHRGKRKLIAEIRKEGELHINQVFNKGVYNIEVSFRGIEDTVLKDTSKNCEFFEIYLSVIDIGNILGNEGNIEKFVSCEEKFLTGKLIPNSHQSYNLITFNKRSSENGDDIANPYLIQISASQKPSKFIGEFIYNNVLDTIINFEVNRIQVHNKSGNNQLSHVQHTSEYNDNIAWIILNIDPEYDYLIKLHSSVFNKESNICSKMFFSYSYNDEDGHQINDSSAGIEKEEIKKEICRINDIIPNNLYTKDTVLDKFGGHQNEDGSIKLVGEFMVPHHGSSSNRIGFKINKDSIVFIQVIPKYNENNNISLQIYRDKNLIYRYGHSIINGVILINLISYNTPYILEMTFDEESTNKCNTFEFMFTVIPKEIYLSEHLNCEENVDKIPQEFLIDKSIEEVYYNYYNLENNVLHFLTDENKNLEFIINLNLTKMFTINMYLKFLLSDNLMDIVLLDKNSDEVLEIGKEIITRSEDYDGILMTKHINVNLKPGKYEVKLVHKTIFNEMLRNVFGIGEKHNFCQPFIFEINSVNLEGKIKHQEKENIDQTEQDNVENNGEIENFEKKDLIDHNIENFIINVEPSKMKDIKLGHDLIINVDFEFALSKKLEFSRAFYLIEKVNDQIQGNKIFPLSSIINHKKTITLNFDSNTLTHRKCYTLKYDFSGISNTSHKFIEDDLDHTYCTTKCICNQYSDFKCTSKGKCKCHSPYTGEKCEKCEEGFYFDGKYCLKTLKNCNDKEDCNSHGKCKIDLETKKKYCDCDKGFASNSDKFCNICTDSTKFYPQCTNKNDERESLAFNWESDCGAEGKNGYSLPENLYNYENENDEFLGSVQNPDGSVHLHGVLVAKKEIEQTKIMIPEDSFIKVFFFTKELNRAKIQLHANEDDAEPIAITNGSSNIESFVAKLEHREMPYYIKIIHSGLKSSCTKYELIITIKPINLIFSYLKCKTKVKRDDNLPETKLILGDQNSLKEFETFIIPENLIVDYKKIKKNKKKSKDNSNFKRPGVLSQGNHDEEFAYNILISVVNHPVIFSSSIEFDFLTNDLQMTLLGSDGNVLQASEYLIPVIEEQVQNTQFVSTINITLEPGDYYLTIVQGLSANMLVQILHEEDQFKKKMKCFYFNMHFETSIINKPDPGISTKKFEAMFNKVIDVEPSSINNINVDKKLEIYVTFQESLKTNTKDNKLTLEDAFYLENEKTKARVNPKHTYIQGKRSNKFLIYFRKKSFEKDTCYNLKFNLDILVSIEDDRKIMDDSPIVHKYCTKSCDCNPFTDFECDEYGKCICESPYSGPGCYLCEKDHFMAHYRCINQENCRKNYCNDYGTCRQTTDKPENYPQCDCDEDFRGSDQCDQCTNSELTFPQCQTKEKLEKIMKEKDKNIFLQDELVVLEKNDNELVNPEKDSFSFNCFYSMIPVNFDTLGFLQLNGHMHISGLYSLKHFENKHYSTKFTIKERSHLKIYLEFTKKTHIITMMLVKNNNVLYEGNLHFGPAGPGTTTYLDVIIDPIKDGSTYLPYEIKYFIKDSMINDEMDKDQHREKSETLFSECFNVYFEVQLEIAKHSQYEPMCKERTLVLFPQESSLTQVYSQLSTNVNDNSQYFYDRNKHTLTSTVYFFHEYFYVPDMINKNLNFFFQITSKFINSHLGVMLESLEIPELINGRKVDHSKLTTRQLKEYFKDVQAPECKYHCFSGFKKLNSVVIKRILSPHTFWRMWVYDFNPIPQGSVNNEVIKCIEYDFTFNHTYEDTHGYIQNLRKNQAICQNDYLLTDLNVRGYVGNSVYFQKWGFHILDHFRIDHVSENGNVHDSKFSIENYGLFRIVVEHDKIDIDLELYRIENKLEVMIARSTAKKFENSIAIEIPEGSYILRYKFYPENEVLHNCERVKQEFSIHYLNFLQENIDRTVAKYNNKQKTLEIDIFEHLKKVNNNDIFHQKQNNFYLIENKPAFIIGQDDNNSYQASVVVSEFNFVIEESQSHMLELVSYIASDFSLIDVSLYLYEMKTQRTIQAVHRKNMNVLFTGPLSPGNYIFSIRYYRRLKYIEKNGKPVYNLNRDNFAEVEFNASFLNKGNDTITILTSGNKLKIKSSKEKNLSHNWFCRNYGSPIPDTLNSLRYLEFSKDMHILDNYIVPPVGGDAQNIIKFHIKHLPNMMLRVYVESKEIDIDIKLRRTLRGVNEIVGDSLQTAHFATLMAIIENDIEYEIIISFKSQNVGFEECKTFKMEIATEVSHNYACSDTSKSIKLTDLKPIPNILPLTNIENTIKIFKYYSKELYPNTHQGSGYVYMFRSEKDKELKFASFQTTEEISFRLEISFDFIQAPINVFITHQGTEESEKNKINDSNIIEFGDIFENRNVLIVKNLPIGHYDIYIYLPGLKTKFINEKVCSLYDIIFEVKSSKDDVLSSEQEKLHDITDNHLDPSLPIPINLNTFWNEENYMNHHNYYYFMNTGVNKNELVQSINFNLHEESIVKFLVENINNRENEIVMSIKSVKGKTDYRDSLYTKLDKGEYTLELKEILKTGNELHSSTLNNKGIFLFYIGLSSIKRLNEIYNYNGIQSATHQCMTTVLPISIDSANSDEGAFHFHNEKAFISTKDLSSKEIAKIKLEIRDPSLFFAEISTDSILNPLDLVVRSSHEEWFADWSENVGTIHMRLPQGMYEISINLENEIIKNNVSCVLFGLNIHIFDLKRNIELNDLHGHKDKNYRNIARCETSNILPLEVSQLSLDSYSRISHEGSYYLHLPKILYYKTETGSNNSKNANSINIVVDKFSLIRVTATVPNPKEYQLLPSLKYMKKITNGNSKKYKKKNVVSEKITELTGLINHSLSDRNHAYFVKENTSSNYYKLELKQEMLEELTEDSPSYTCPYYGVDLLISSIDEIINTIKCPDREGQIVENVLPSQKVILQNNRYNQYIDFSFFTEKQFSTYFSTKNQLDEKVFQYFIPFELKQKSLISIEFGYSHLISLFDIFLSKQDDGDSFESRLISIGISVFKDVNEALPHRKIINVTVDPGKYVLNISEHLWSSIHIQLMSMKLESLQNLHLCLPFIFNFDIQKAEEDGFIKAEIIAIYPPGPVVFIGEDEEIKIMIKFNKNVFTNTRQSITSFNNFNYLLNAFYLSEKITNTVQIKDKDFINKSPESDEELSTVYASKIEGSEDGKEWQLFFVNVKLNKGHDYSLKLNNGMLFDMNHMEFINSKSLPSFRLESSYEEQINLANDSEKLKKKFEEVKSKAIDDSTEYKYENTTIKDEQKDVINMVNRKCGKHGKEVFDNMIRKWLCSCTDGFTGKFCDICQGKIEKETGRCFIPEDDEDQSEENKNDHNSVHENSVNQNSFHETRDNQNTAHTPDKEITKLTSEYNHNSNTPPDNSNHNYNNKCGGCEQGFCDSKNGKCICNDGWTGVHCDRRIFNVPRTEINKQQQSKPLTINVYFKSLLYILGIIFIIILYSIIRKQYFGMRQNDYSPIDKDEFVIENKARDDRKLELFDNEANFVEMTKKKKENVEKEKKKLLKDPEYNL